VIGLPLSTGAVHPTEIVVVVPPVWKGEAGTAGGKGVVVVAEANGP